MRLDPSPISVPGAFLRSQTIGKEPENVERLSEPVSPSQKRPLVTVARRPPAFGGASQPPLLESVLVVQPPRSAVQARSSALDQRPGGRANKRTKFGVEEDPS
eukprot:9273112-Alexandrium_andersonii.AAC.1